MTAQSVPVYLESGSHRVFAGALDWPGWCRSGKDEAAALRSLFEYRSRYERALRGSPAGFRPPAAESALKVVERLRGDATTDFGSPGRAPARDAEPPGAAERERAGEILRACWREFDRAVDAAAGKALRKGPRGGGRTLKEIVAHVFDAELAYLGKLGWTFKPAKRGYDRQAFEGIRAAILEGLAASAAGEIPARGPRGGSRWTARYFVRRASWHALDHSWEIEDRSG
jgi:hypothetical protein